MIYMRGTKEEKEEEKIMVILYSGNTGNKKKEDSEQEENSAQIKGKIKNNLTNPSYQEKTASYILKKEEEEEEREHSRKGQYNAKQPHYQPIKSHGGGGAEEFPQQHLVKEPDDGEDTRTKPDPSVKWNISPYHQPIAHQDSGGEDQHRAQGPNTT